MDAADISVATRFEKQLNFLEANMDFVLCGSWYQEIPTQHIAQLPCSHADIKAAMLTSNVIFYPSVMFRKDFFIQHQLYYNRDFEPAEDYELWTTLIALGEINNLPEVLIYYRLHDQQVSEQHNAHQRKYAAITRKKFLQYLTPIPPDENELLEKILSGTRLDTIPELYQAIAILDRLATLNSSKAVFTKTGFAAFIE